ncbi:ABC transporter ATP-binding protein [Occultella aeris]|uniref:Oligopeptide transport ATP-binding protein OppD n=1 Tax=Occultella aeris TaxID=2761496 RepID=A0A7M4DME8_9MICO|nr:ABC transporter ATP-binding protein [Occultella aeris]VZO38558.1 Oligopeptide transport ATP-binding protein OppD [Occultella aeris]
MNNVITPTLSPDRSGVGTDGPTPLLRIRGLETHFDTADGVVKAVDGVDLTVRPGTTMCLVGESGCGKSATARSILQVVESPGRIAGGEILWSPHGKDLVDLAKLDGESEQLRQIRGGDIGMVFQEPMASLSPLYTVGAQLMEVIRLHQDVTEDEARERAVGLLERVGIPNAAARLGSYPFQLSGGMCQRVMIAIALSCNPALLIADEPTTALDVTTQARILDLLRELQAEFGMAILFITHDLGVVAEIADEVTVMYLGKSVEQAPVDELFRAPKHPYTRALLQSIPDGRPNRQGQPLPTVAGMVPSPRNRPTGCTFRTRCSSAMPGICDQEVPPASMFGNDHLARCHLYSHEDATAIPEPTVAVTSRLEVTERTNPTPDEEAATLLEVRGLTKHYPLGGGMFRRSTGTVHAVDGVDLVIREGETLGLVGESGCGKTTLGRCIAGLLGPTSGEILFHRDPGHAVDLASLSSRQLKGLRTQIRTIFQDPFSSLNPRMTVEQIVGEPLQVNKLARGSELRDRVADMLRRVGIRPEYMRRYPHAFSGGERQRLNIARALITQPRLVIADEPVSALDVSIRAQILNLLDEIREEFNLTYLFISHDLSVVEHVSDRVAVMYLGKVAEQARTSDLYDRPLHPYTETLLDSIPVPDPQRRNRERERTRTDDLPDPANPPAGCLFHTRCPHVQERKCASDVPELRLLGTDHRAACHFAEELQLTGMSRSDPSE